MLPGTPLQEMVIDNLRGGLSPEQIAGTLKRMAPALTPVRLSHEAIYQAIYAMPRGELRTELIALLRHGHAKPRQAPSPRPALHAYDVSPTACQTNPATTNT